MRTLNAFAVDRSESLPNGVALTVAPIFIHIVGIQAHGARSGRTQKTPLWAVYACLTRLVGRVGACLPALVVVYEMAVVLTCHTPGGDVDTCRAVAFAPAAAVAQFDRVLRTCIQANIRHIHLAGSACYAIRVCAACASTAR